MPITRDPDYPAEIGHLIQGMNRLANGHSTLHVVEAAANFLIAAIHGHVRQGGQSREVAARLAAHIGERLPADVLEQWDRVPKSTDVDVPMGGN